MCLRVFSRGAVFELITPVVLRTSVPRHSHNGTKHLASLPTTGVKWECCGSKMDQLRPIRFGMFSASCSICLNSTSIFVHFMSIPQITTCPGIAYTYLVRIVIQIYCSGERSSDLAADTSPDCISRCLPSRPQLSIRIDVSSMVVRTVGLSWQRSLCCWVLHCLYC